MKTKFLTQLKKHEIALVHLAIFVLIAEIAWILTPYFIWHGHAPFASVEQRIYVISFIFLIWLLKMVTVNLSITGLKKPSDKKIQETLNELENRFLGALQFLNKTQVSSEGQPKALTKLPWCLVIGSSHAGKTSLLLNSDVEFVLKRQFNHPDKQNLPPSDHCDWWVTRETTFIDIPGKYFATPISLKNKRPFGHSILWLSLLRLIRYYRGKNGVQSILIALPLTEIMHHADEKNHQMLFRNLFYQLQDFQKIFPNPIPCHIVITKCDLLPGFLNFFSELSKEELNQTWGINLSHALPGQINKAFTEQFNALIKKVNEQLIWRMHQERNIEARIAIKDFPLQVECLKMALAGFINKLMNAELNLFIQNVHLTSAVQSKSDDLIHHNTQEVDNNTRTLQLFTPPTFASKSYFIKNLLSRKFSYKHAQKKSRVSHLSWSHYGSLASSAGIIGVFSLCLGQDFLLGSQQAHATQNHLARFKVAATHAQDPDEKLSSIIHLLNSLSLQLNEPHSKTSLSHPVVFYTNKAQQKIIIAYQNALHAVLLPEIKTYFEYYLQNPVNKTADDVYAVFKAYLMLNDTAHLDINYLVNILPLITQNPNTLLDLKFHVTQALQSKFAPMDLDEPTVQSTRRYLNALPTLKLAYILLKHQIPAHDISEIKLISDQSAIFKNIPPIYISKMFTAESFTSIYAEQTSQVVNEIVLGKDWVLGNYPITNTDQNGINALVDQLRTLYVNNYIDVWEHILNQVQLAEPINLAKMDEMIVQLMSQGSPLLSLLQTLHDNTYFAPIVTIDTKLGKLVSILEKNPESQTKIYQIFSSLQTLHLYLHNILIANDTKKAAFIIASERMLNHGAPDAITQLHIVAATSPEPLKSWLEKIANVAWHNLMQEAGHYLDTSWQTHVIPYFQTHLANRYPFNPNVTEEVNIKQFYEFFGKTGIMPQFYHQYLNAFIDQSSSPWKWKELDNEKLALSAHTLAQIQHAMQLHVLFFPGMDNKISEKYALQLRRLNLKKINQNKNFFALNLNPLNTRSETYA